MATANDTQATRHLSASNWNVLHSKVVPSGVSGSHKAASSTSSVSSVRIQTSDETLTIKARKSPAFYESAHQNADSHTGKS